MENRFFTRRAVASAFFVAALSLGSVASGCGREPSMATKSAAAYRDAVAQGLPIGSGHGGHEAAENGDHAHVTPPAGTAEPEPGAEGGAHGHLSRPSESASGADAGSMAGMDHSLADMHHSRTAQPAGAAPPMAGMDHAHADSGTAETMTGMDHSKPAPATASPMAGMDHAAMGHETPAAIPEPARTPSSSSEIGRLDPAKTLSLDEFDRVVAPPSTGGAEEKP